VIVRDGASMDDVDGGCLAPEALDDPPYQAAAAVSASSTTITTAAASVARGASSTESGRGAHESVRKTCFTSSVTIQASGCNRGCQCARAHISLD
jgi:hypothetical protein